MTLITSELLLFGQLRLESTKKNGRLINTAESLAQIRLSQKRLYISLLLHYEFFQSESIWRDAGKRCIWFKIDNAQSQLIPVLIQNGYDFHHAKPGGAMLKKWLPLNERDNVPHYPFTFIGLYLNRIQFI